MLCHCSGADLHSAQHNASSPLLKLPLEIKNLIYKYSFGGHLIHIIQNPEKGGPKFKNTICRALISEEEAQENFEAETTHPWYAPVNEGRHNLCRFQKKGRSPVEEGRPEVFNLSALRCCRQMYNEAHHIPYSKNTFSCDDPETLRNFVVSLAQGNHGNHLAVRSLFLEMEVNVLLYGNEWRTAVFTCTKHLKALQNISMSMEWGPWYEPIISKGRADWDEQQKRGRYSVINTVLALKKLPLKTVTIVASDLRGEEEYTIHAWLSSRVTLDTKKEWTRYLREKLLQSNQ